MKIDFHRLESIIKDSTSFRGAAKILSTLA